jgi:NAD(P)H-flavin reductase
MFPIKLRIKRIDKHTPQVWSFFMTPVEGPRPDFIPGQVAVLEMEGHQGSYIAFASAPEDEEYEFLIKRSSSMNVTGGLFDPHIAKQISLREIVGTGFPVDDYRGHDLVMVAMGTGLAPLRSVLRHIFQARADYGRVVVLYGARTMDDFCFEEEMMTLWVEQGVELRQVVSQPGEREWSGPTGYVQSLLDNLIPTLANPVALVCGSSEMIEQTRERLHALGFPRERIKTNF